MKQKAATGHRSPVTVASHTLTKSGAPALQLPHLTVRWKVARLILPLALFLSSPLLHDC